MWIWPVYRGPNVPNSGRFGALGGHVCRPFGTFQTVSEGVFCEVGLSLLLRVCGLFFLHDLKSLDHLEGEAHYAALLALVLDVDGLLIVVDEYLRHKTAVVVEPLRPLGDILVLYLLGLLAHPHALLPSTVSFYPKVAPCIPQRGAQASLFTRAPRSRVVHILDMDEEHVRRAAKIVAS